MSESIDTMQSDVQTTATDENVVASSENIINESPAVTNEVDFLGSISEGLRSEACLKDFKDLDSLAKSYINAQKMIGSSIRLPSEDASPEARADFFKKLETLEDVVVKPKSGDTEALEAFYKKLGRPETIDGYNIDELIPTDFLEKLPSLEDDLHDLKDIAFKIGLSKDQVSKMVELRIGALKEAQVSLETSKEAGIKTLKDKWGTEYANRLEAAKTVAKIYSEKFPEASKELFNSSAGNNPALINILAEMGATFKEKGHEGMTTTQFGMTPEQAKDKIAELRADRGFHEALYTRSHPGHDEAVAKITKLAALMDAT